MFFSLVVFSTSYAVSPKNTVNILTWSNYLRAPEIGAIVKKKCGVTIYYDEFYSNSEFLGRFGAKYPSYDIIIFPDVLYDHIKDNDHFKDKTKNCNSRLSDIAKNYSEEIKKHYDSYNYSSNIVFFVFSVSGFVWHPGVIDDLTKDDTIFSVFNKSRKSRNRLIILANDRAKILNVLFGGKKNLFRKIAKNIVLYVTDGFNRLYNDKNFAFAFQSSGNAVDILKRAEQNLSFLSHPKFSNISADLLAELNCRKETRCVAKTLAGKEILEIVQRKAFFLSPYNTYKSVKDPEFQAVYKNFNNINRLKWVGSVTGDDYKKLTKEWESATVFLIKKGVIKIK